MTDVLIYDVCFGEKSLTFDKTMDYVGGIPDDVNTATENADKEEEIHVDVTGVSDINEEMDDANDEPLDVGTEDMDTVCVAEEEKSRELACLEEQDLCNVQLNIEENQEENQSTSLKTDITANKPLETGEKQDKEKCSEDLDKLEDRERKENINGSEILVEGKQPVCTEEEETEPMCPKESYDSEWLAVKEWKKDIVKNEKNLNLSKNHQKFENLPAAADAFTFGANDYEKGIKHERKSDKLKREKGHPKQTVNQGSAENSGEEICFTDESDFENDHETFDRGNLLLKSLSESCDADGKDLLKFAEVLYKCTLCTSIPSILTSEESFIQHVNKQHLSKDTRNHTCKLCLFKFRTEEDLKEHIIYSHTGSDENLSCDLTGSDVTVPLDQMIDSNNDSDSDSSGHRQLRTKVVKRSKPVNDFESPKQLVDHTGIETLNGSLDLTQKTAEEKREEDRFRCTKSSKESGEINIKQITDQIIKSDVQGRNVSNGNATKLSFIPSYTTEFGKYTKLVREGGNIVYFCQLCNWKSPIKTTFQVHCNMSSHKSKVLSAENPEENIDRKSVSPKHCEKTTSHKIKSENVRDKQDCKRPYSAHDISVGPRMPEQNLFYNFIMRPRASTQCRARTPVVSPYGASSFIEDARFTYKRPNENPVDLAMKKRKRFVKHPKFGHSSDSDSDDGSLAKKCLSVNSSHSTNMTLLRQKLLEGNSGNKQKCHNIQRHITKGFYESSSFPADPSFGSPKAKIFDSSNKKLDLQCVKKEKFDYPVFGASDLSKDLIFLARSNSPMEKDHGYKWRMDNGGRTEESVLPAYRCHACSFRYSDVEEYERHFEKVHKSSFGTMFRQKETFGSRGYQWFQGQRDSGPGSKLMMDSEGTLAGRNGEPAGTGSSEMGENWRVQKLKEILPDYVIECDRGNTSRDNLLQCISSSSGMQDAVLWSSACNRAMRELYPSSQAQRKGKYKKTFYFGISMLDSYQAAEELPGTDGESPLYQPHRDINVDMEKIVELIPTVLKWTGNMESGVYRQDLLILLTDTIQDSDVNNWGAQCNRAIRLVFPNIDMKRKGKYKTTMYLGVEFNENVLKRLSKYSNSSINLQQAEIGRKSPGDIPADNIVPTGQKKGRTLERLLTKGSNSPENGLQFSGINAKNSSPIMSYPQWMKKEAEDEMGQYIAKFGGVTMFDTQTGFQNGSTEAGELDDDAHVGDSVGTVDQGGCDETAGSVTVDQGDANDGDDEGESLDSVKVQ